MSLCNKCNELVQSAAVKSVMKKKEQLGIDDSENGKIVTDPFVVMWVPETETPQDSGPKYYPPNPNCLEYDYTLDLNTGAQECRQRFYPIRPRKVKEY